MELFWIHFTAHNLIYQLAFVLYGLALVLYTVEQGGWLIFSLKNNLFRKLTTATFILAWGMLSFWFIDRWLGDSRPPIRTLYESMILWCLTVSLVYIAIQFLYNLRFFGVVASLTCLSILIYATLNRDTEMAKLPPALQSPWFIPHVMCYFVAYGAYLIAALFGLLYLFAPGATITRESGFAGAGEGTVTLNFEEMSFEIIRFAFVFSTIAISLGCVWAKFAWGDWWGWDPKENWAFITWLVYLCCIHLRFVPSVKGRFFAALTVIALFVVVFTYLGMAYLPTANDSLHVFQGNN